MLKPPPSSTEQDSSAFLKRWSRRKVAADQSESPSPDTLTDANAIDRVATEPAPAATELSDADMPELETLEEGSNFSQFMSPKVSDRLRRAALAKLFHLPRFNIRDGLDDYDEDFTFFEPLGDTVTADMRLRQEYEAEQRRLAEHDSDAVQDSSPETAPASNAAEAEAPSPEESDDTEQSVEREEDSDDILG